MIRREYYYHYGNTAITAGVPEKKSRRKLVSSTSANNNNNDNNRTSGANNGGEHDGEVRLQTADGFTSARSTAAGNRPVMRAKWNKGGRRTELQHQKDRVKQTDFDDIAQHCKSLRNDPATHLIDFSER